MAEPAYDTEDLGNSPDGLEEEYGLSSVLVREIVGALEEEGAGPRLHDLLVALHPADLAELIKQLSSGQREKLINIIRTEFDAQVIAHLEGDIRDEIIEYLGPEASAAFISQLESDDAVQVIEDLSHKEQQEILEDLPEETRAEVEEALSYPESSAGRLMRKDMVTIPEAWTVGDTIDYLRAQSEHLPDDFYAVFVVNAQFQPIASVMLSRIMQSERDVKIRDIMYTEIKSFLTTTDQEEVGYVFRKYGLVEAPVVNEEGRLAGVITVDDVVHVIEEEGEEDLMRMAGMKEQDLHAGLFSTVRRRLPWLFVNILTALVASRIIGAFEGAIEKLVTLAVLMPIVASIGGNAGTQALTTAVRAISSKELKGSNAWQVIRKEMLTGLLNGICLAIVTASAIALWYRDYKLGLVFGAALIINLLVAGFAGTFIPVLFNRSKIDPAVSSGIFLTMLTDSTGFFAFLALATVFLM